MVICFLYDWGPWVMPKRVVEVLGGWKNCFGKRRRFIWNMIHLCLMWIIWREKQLYIYAMFEWRGTRGELREGMGEVYAMFV